MQSTANKESSSMVLDNLLGIIDSKIQYLEYKLSMSYNRLVQDGRMNPHSPISSPEISASIQSKLDSIEGFNKIVQKLLYFKSKVNQENAERATKFLFDSNIEELDLEKMDEMI